MDDFTFRDIEALSAELPEDIAKRKWRGDFKGADRLAELWLQREIPELLRKKLTLEREILRQLPQEYPYTRQEAFEKLQKIVPDLTESEFRALQDQGRIDWIYIDGEERFFNRFAETLVKVNADIRRRAEAETVQEPDAGKQALLQVIQKLKKEKESAYRFRIRASLRIKDEAFQPGFVRVHIPVPAENSQMQDIHIVGASSERYLLSPGDSGQRTVCFEEDMTTNHEFYVEYEYTNRVDYVELWQERDCPVGAAVSAEELSGTAGDFSRYLGQQLPHIRFTPYMKALAEQLTAGAENPLEKAGRIYDYITTRVEYSFVRSYFTIENLTEYAAIGGKGDCGIQALMFITLCRLSGVPAGWQSGLYTTPFSAGCHDWAQVYIAPFGWRYVDCSFGGSAFRDGDEERRRFYFGNLDPFRMVANTEFQQEFHVPKRFLRADPYDNQRGEAEYAHKGLDFGEIDWKAEVLSAQELKL